MGRNSKQSCDYFPLDCHVDDKLKIIKFRFGMEGYGILIALYQLIYSSGYFVEFGEEEQLIFASENRIDESKLTELIQHCVSKNIFSDDIYTTYGVLTSRGIQKRFKEICYRRKSIELIREYVLIKGQFSKNDVIYNLSGELVADGNRINDNINQQRKEKEKEKEKGEEINENVSTSSPKTLLEAFHQIHPDCEKIGQMQFDAAIMASRTENGNPDVPEAIEVFARHMAGVTKIPFPLREFEKYLRNSSKKTAAPVLQKKAAASGRHPALAQLKKK